MSENSQDQNTDFVVGRGANINDNNLNFIGIINEGTNSDNNNNNNRNNFINNLRNTNNQYNSIYEFLITPLKNYVLNLKTQINNLKLQLARKDKEIEDLDKKCSVCFVNKANIIFIPCGHLCMCNDCNIRCTEFNINFCPICRNNGNRYTVYT